MAETVITERQLKATTAKARAYRNAAQTISSGAWTKVQLNAETYDPGSNFDSSTNYRFVAPVSGYYLVTAQAKFNTSVDGNDQYTALYRDGGAIVNSKSVPGTGNGQAIGIADIVTLTASQYLELYVYHGFGAGTYQLNGSAADTFMSVHLLSLS